MRSVDRCALWEAGEERMASAWKPQVLCGVVEPIEVGICGRRRCRPQFRGGAAPTGVAGVHLAHPPQFRI